MSEAFGIVKPERRWKAVIEYRSDDGVLDIVHVFDEIAELHDLIERGPHWDTMIRCEITHFREPHGECAVPLTVEAAEKL